nr:MAG TPA: hypothetical protein [Caudoviricetes sp.]
MGQSPPHVLVITSLFDLSATSRKSYCCQPFRWRQ